MMRPGLQSSASLSHDYSLAHGGWRLEGLMVAHDSVAVTESDQTRMQSLSYLKTVLTQCERNVTNHFMNANHYIQETLFGGGQHVGVTCFDVQYLHRY